MAEAILVEPDIQAGLEFVRLLDSVNLDVKGAFWFYYPDSERWRLVIVSDQAKAGAKPLYLKAIEAGAKMDLASVEFQDLSSPVYKGLLKLVHMPGLGTARLSRNVINGVYIDQAIVYRLIP